MIAYITHIHTRNAYIGTVSLARPYLLCRINPWVECTDSTHTLTLRRLSYGAVQMGVDRTYVRASVFDSFPIELMAGIAVRWRSMQAGQVDLVWHTPYISVSVVARALIMPLVTRHPRVVRP